MDRYLKEETDWLWLCSIPGIYRKERNHLLEQFGTPKRLRTISEKDLASLVYLKPKQRKSILEFQQTNPEELLERNRKKEIQFYSCQHPFYPKLLREVSDYPHGIFVKGELPPQEQRCISIVGARMCTNYGRKMAKSIAYALGEHGVSVVSGMAMGIDGIAQSACLDVETPSYAVVGSGCDICYPREHIELYEALSQRGGIISEYPPGTPALAYHFPQRNRIISGLSECVIVVEAKRKSGSLITADQALEQGRDVYALPGRVGDPLSEGCNQLIEMGAGIITGVDALLKALDIETRKPDQKKEHDLKACENMVYLFLDSHGKSLEELAECTHYSVTEVMTALMQLQLKGLAVQINQNRYALK